MDLIGDIVEHDVQTPTAPVAPMGISTGFPALKKFERRRTSRRERTSEPAKKTSDSVKVEEEVQERDLSEAEKSHEENVKKIALLTTEEIAQEQQELLQGLDPKLIQSLLRRTEKRSHDHDHDHTHAEGYDGWIGGGRNGVELPHLDSEDVNRALGVKTVRFDESKPEEHVHEDGIDDDDEIAPSDYQIVPDEEDDDEPDHFKEVDVHFPKPKREEDLDLDDPDFFDKLHEKYYPDLPKETNKLAWMTEKVPQKRVTTYEAISDMRFDFKGNLVELEGENSKEIPTHLGLHHHSDNPQLAGYTLVELAHLSRSVVPTQRCFSIQMLGRILHKLGLHKYNIMPIPEEDSAFTQEVKEVVETFEDMMWDLIEQLRIIESLTEAADENRTKNLSVRTYAIEALWLWKEGGGRKEVKPKSEEDIIAQEVNM